MARNKPPIILSNIITDFPSIPIGTISPNQTVVYTTILKYNKLPITYIRPPKYSVSPKKPSI